MSSTNDESIAIMRQSIKALNMQREALEQEAAAIVSELTEVNPSNPTVPSMGIDTPLVDSEGFPRNDIDVYRARMLRGRFAEIKTDHKKFMLEIEVLLKQLALLQKPGQAESEKKEQNARMQVKPKPKFDPVTGKWVVRNWDGTIAGAGKESQGRSFDNLNPKIRPEAVSLAAEVDRNLEIESSAATSSSAEVPVVYRAAESTTPLARVESVAPTSPAAAAGLLVNDIVLAFGSIVTDMHEIMNLVRTAAANSAFIELRIQRGPTMTPTLLQLQPRPWNGRGLLGCHIVPV